MVLKCGGNMLFSINEKKSFAFIQILVALLTVFMPALIGIMPLDTGVYLLFLLFVSAKVMRIRNTKKIQLSIFHAVILILICYSIAETLWVSNKNGNLLYIVGLGTVLAIFSVMCEYFSECKPENASRRITYLLSFGGVLCAVINLLYWMFYIVPFAKNESFSRCFNNNDLLAVFMLICISAALSLIKGNNKIRKKLIWIFVFVMLVVFIMAKSFIAWVMLALLSILCYADKKLNKAFFPMAVCVTALFAVIVAVSAFSGERGDVAYDVFAHGIKSVVGKGGGFWSSRALFLMNPHQSGTTGLIAFLTASSGVIGFLCAIVLLALNVVCFYKLKDWSSFICLLATVSVFFLPMNNSAIATFMLVGLMAYNFTCAGMVMNRCVKTSEEDTLKKAVYVICVTLVVSALMLILSLVRINASVKFAGKDYKSAYSLYKITSSINITDSESCRMAVVSLRKGNNLKRNYNEALELIEKAIERDPDNIENAKEKALLYYECEKFEDAVQEYRKIVKMSKNDDDCNLLLVQSLYEIVERLPKGSGETRRIYEEILEIARSTVNLDYKKQINDIADKALVFTKGEISSEN